MYVPFMENVVKWNESTVRKSRSVVAWGRAGSENLGRMEMFTVSRRWCWGVGMSTLIEVPTLNMCSLLYVSETSVKL